SSYTAAQYWVKTQAEGGEEVVQTSFIVLPALSGKLPEVHILDVLPDKLYAQNTDQVAYVKGSGFESLRGNWDATVALVRESDGQRYAIEDISVTDDQQ